MILDYLWPVPLIVLAVWVWRETAAYRRETRAERPDVRRLER